MTTYGRSARLLRRYGLWTLAVTAAAGAATWGVHRSLPVGYQSRATVLVEPRHATGAPDLDTERQIILSDVVSVPAAARVGVDATRLLDGLTIETAPGANVLRFVYTASDGVAARVRVRALVDSYAAYRPGVSVLSEPNLPTEPAARPLVPDLAAGLAAGLLLGAGTAFLRSRTRRTLRGRDDFAALTGAPVLATVPRHRRATTPIVLSHPDSPAAESYRYLRSRLQPSLRPTGTTTILVTSPGRRQGRTTTAANLAVTLARTGRDVVLVDADLGDPQLHHVFQTGGDHGLTTLLDGDATVSEVLEDTPVPHLRLIPAGPRDGEHADLLDSGQLARVLRAVQKHADVIVLDTTAVLSAADPIALAALSDQVLLVGDFARTRRHTVRRALDELAEVLHGNVRPVLVNVPKSAGALVPRTRPATRTRDRLVSDADDVAPPAVTSHSYVAVDDTPADPLADYHARTSTVAVPVIYGAVYTSSSITSADAAVTSPEPAVASPESVITCPEWAIASPDSTVTCPDSTVACPDSTVACPDSAVTCPDSLVAFPREKCGPAAPETPEPVGSPTTPGVVSD